MSFVVAVLVAPGFIAVGTSGVALALVRDAHFTQVGLWLVMAGAGLALFALYALFALAVTALAGGNPPFQALVETLALTLSAAAMTLGALLAAGTRVRLGTATRSST